MDSITESIVGWLNEQCTQGRPDVSFGPDTQLLEGGLLDSLNFLCLVTHIEESYELTIDEELLIPENFASASAVSLLIRKLTPVNAQSSG